MPSGLEAKFLPLVRRLLAKTEDTVRHKRLVVTLDSAGLRSRKSTHTDTGQDYAVMFEDVSAQDALAAGSDASRLIKRVYLPGRVELIRGDLLTHGQTGRDWRVDGEGSALLEQDILTTALVSWKPDEGQTT